MILQTADSRPVLDVAILAPLPAWKRIQKLMAVFSLQDLMFTLAPAAFKKVREKFFSNVNIRNRDALCMLRFAKFQMRTDL